MSVEPLFTCDSDPEAIRKKLASVSVRRSLEMHNLTPNPGIDARANVTGDGQGAYRVTVSYEIAETFDYFVEGTLPRPVRPTRTGANSILRFVASPASRTADSAQERREAVYYEALLGPEWRKYKGKPESQRDRWKSSQPTKSKPGVKKKVSATRKFLSSQKSRED